MCEYVFVVLRARNKKQRSPLAYLRVEDGPLLPSDWSPDARAFRCSSYGGVVGVTQVVAVAVEGQTQVDFLAGDRGVEHPLDQVVLVWTSPRITITIGAF